VARVPLSVSDLAIYHSLRRLLEEQNRMMPIDREELLSLWKNIEDIPACEEGMDYARAFLEVAGECVDELGACSFSSRVRGGFFKGTCQKKRFWRAFRH
jgi:hypothetical protein